MTLSKNSTAPSTASPTRRRKTVLLWLGVSALLLLIACLSLFIGKYPITLSGLLAGEYMQVQVFWTLRFSRTITALIGGACLGASGFVYQTVFRNPLASPDIIGVSSGASAGAAAGILLMSGTFMVTVSAFVGALAAVGIALALASIDRNGRNSTIVLAGIAVHALAQTVLMCLKLIADPEKELASIEYWIMGSLNGISIHTIGVGLTLCVVCSVILFFLHRQIILLSAEESEARMMGVSVGKLRVIILLVATLAVASIISLTGLISFVGLLAPHAARLLTKHNKVSTMALSAVFGSILLCAADIFARSAASSELPVSIFTSLLGAPFLILLIVKRRSEA